MQPTDQPIIKAIATEYRGHRFRSRLEARWACFFDNVGWTWEYEALDLDGYIPDFILTFPNAPVLVEVKPVLYEKDFAKSWEKIMASGWDKEALIVGAKIFESNGWGSIGSHCERDEQGAWCEGRAIIHTCEKCKRLSFHNETYCFFCRVNGCYDGDHYLDIPDFQFVRKLFADCGGVVQYNS